MESKRLRIMLITYVFPPFAAVGVYRILKFCKYLTRFGIDPVILTPENPNTMAKDEGLMAMVPPDLPVYRTPIYEPFRWKPDKQRSTSDSKPAAKQAAEPQPPSPPSLLSRIKKRIKQELTVPDGSRFWTWSGLKPGVKCVRDEKIDVVLSSSPPQSIHLLGSKIARKARIPHIADFRDLWTQNTSYAERNLPARLARRDRAYEEDVLRHASGVTVNTDTFRRQILEKNEFLNDDQVVVVNNGVDPDDFTTFLEGQTTNEKFTMLYTGSLYGKHRDPEFFFNAVRQWFDSDPEAESMSRLVFIGNWSPGFDGLPARYGLDSVVERAGWMPQREALAAPFSADLLLLFQGFDPVLSAAIPRKLFEYMITNKPILAFAPDGEIPKAIHRYAAGQSLADPSPEPIVAALRKAFSAWRENKNRPVDPTLRSMPELETLGQVEELARLCHEIV